MARADWQSLSDGELLRRCRQQPEAFGELYYRHERLVAGFLLRATRDPEVAADLTAETFATALEKAHRFRDDGGASAAGWLLGIARNQLLHLLRKDRVETRARRRLGIPEIHVSDRSLERLTALSGDELDEPLRRALNSLSSDEQQAIRAYIIDETPHAEAAARLGVSEPTIRQRVSRGLAKLRTALGVRES